jgi:hypothetical protein
MTQSISVRREGDLIVIEDREDTGDHKGVLKTSYLTPDAAIALFENGLTIACLIKFKAGVDAAIAARTLPLATASDPYPEDAR